MNKGKKLTPTQEKLQDQLWSRFPNIIQEAKEIRLEIDPLQSLIDLLNNQNGDYDTWERITKEFYG